MKILLVDDERDLSELVVELLSDFEVVVAYSDAEALTKTEGVTHAMVDSLGSKGFPLAKKLKSMGIKTYSFSGNNEIKNEEVEAYDGLISKPFDIKQLIKLFS